MTSKMYSIGHLLSGRGTAHAPLNVYLNVEVYIIRNRSSALQITDNMAVNHLSIIQLVCLLIFASANFINAKNIDSSADLGEPGKLIDGPNAGLMLKAMADRQNGCYWDGTAPFCRGSCPSNYFEKSSDSCGNGKCCSRGEKKYCCPKPSTGCYWDGTAPICRGNCPNGFHQKKADKRGDGKYCVSGDKKYCCPNLRLL